MRDWLTIEQACEHFGVTRRTIKRWQQKHVIREARFHKRLPIMLNRQDLLAADRESMQANSAIRR